MTLSPHLFKTFLSLLIFLCCIGCEKKPDNVLPGYIEGEYNYIASGIAGTLFQLNVHRGQTVQQNDLLFSLDPEPDKSNMDAAKDNVDDLSAQVDLAQIQLKRFTDLYANHATDKSTLDQKSTDYQIKLQQLSAAENTLRASEWSYHQKTVYAPVSGYVFDTYYRIGEKVAANQPVLSLLTAKNIKVQFFIPEKQLSTIHLNQVITIRCDGCKSTVKATITYISPEAEYTPPIIYSQDTRYKLVYKVKAVLPTDIAMHFHPGQPLDVYLNEP